MVGVPRLVSCDLGPSTRMGWPKPCRRISLASSGVPSSAMSSATAPATMIVFNRAAPRRCSPTATCAASFHGGSR